MQTTRTNEVKRGDKTKFLLTTLQFNYVSENYKNAYRLF